GWRKEVVDQFLHALWAFATFLAPWAWLPLISVSAVSLAGICAREVYQKRDHDGGILENWPWLDTCGYSAGAVLGTVAGVIWL
ncbi:unnamed protein product, partial [marine sediment metagenome]